MSLAYSSEHLYTDAFELWNVFFDVHLVLNVYLILDIQATKALLRRLLMETY